MDAVRSLFFYLRFSEHQKVHRLIDLSRLKERMEMKVVPEDETFPVRCDGDT